MDLFEKCYNYTIAKEVMSAGFYPYFKPMRGNENNMMDDGGQKLIMFGSNNYLGLTSHPKVMEAAMNAIKQYGTSCTGSRFLNGTMHLHEELEHALAQWLGKESALVFSTGMQTNLGVISALCDRNDYVIIDKHAHASLIDGARLSWGKIKRFRHNDTEDLKKVLETIPAESGKLIVVDGVYSMEGDIAPVPEIMAIAASYEAKVLVDDAHATGVLGNGRGTEAYFGINNVDLITSTFSKSFASLGGFVAGKEEIIHYIKHIARSMIFSASLAPPNAASALAALKIMQQEPERIKRVNEIGRRVKAELTAMGFETGHSQTPIVPIIIGDNIITMKAWKFLYENGIFVNAVLAPAVPEGMQLLRTSYMATHTDEQVTRALELFHEMGKQFGLLKNGLEHRVKVADMK
ncbi:MAG: pyridoxal phosphate-dependent aminotransferase family protein [Bacteroidia bacterium]|nr:pyridoxal phosphate-dependent aminotransferase family protein [Bacteroidia bacterium]